MLKIAWNKKLSCRREATRCFVFVCSQLQHTYSAVFLLLVTAASDLPVHKILLNSVLLSPIVSNGVRPNPSPGQTPLRHKPPCLLPFVGRLGSGPHLVGQIGSGVRFSVSFQQKYLPDSVLQYPTAAENGGYDQVGCVRGGGWPLRRITSSPSQTLHHRLVQTTDDRCCGVLDARRRPSWLYFSQFMTRTVDNIVDLYAAKQIFVQNRVFCLLHLHSTPPLEGLPSEYCHAVWYGKTTMMWLPDGKKISKISFFILAQFMNVTERQTDRHRMAT